MVIDKEMSLTELKTGLKQYSTYVKYLGHFCVLLKFVTNEMEYIHTVLP